MRFILLLLLIGALSPPLISHCSSESNSILKTDNEIFNQLLGQAVATIIELDEILVDTLLITFEHISGT